MFKKIIIHGGAGDRESDVTSFQEYHVELKNIIQISYDYLSTCDDALETAIFAVSHLEDNPIFNAGTGSRLQMDGKIRMSSAVMDSYNKKFAGVINIEKIKNPIKVARYLLGYENSVLSGKEATGFAKEHMNMSEYDPITSLRLQEYNNKRIGKTGTVGAVVIDSKGNICSATSTGGVGYEIPGRVGDTPTIAGTYASLDIGVSCTGIGEHIVNSGVAVRINTRVKDGASSTHAINTTISECDKNSDYVGIIAIDKFGNILSKSTSCAQTLYAYHDGVKYDTFYSELGSHN